MAPEKEWDIGESDTDLEHDSGSPGQAADGVREEDGKTPEAPDNAGAHGGDPGSSSTGDSSAESPPATGPAGPTEPADEASESTDDDRDPGLMQKRLKRAHRKELLDLIQRKNDMLMALNKELVKTKQELVKSEDRLLRTAAEFENYRKRTRREWDLLQKNANADLIREIIWGIDNFDRAFANLGGADGQIQDGIRLIHAGLMDILKRAGMTEIEAQNQKFDARYHEAIGEIESDIEEGHVAQVIQKGYLLRDQVLRPARVLVSKAKG